MKITKIEKVVYETPKQYYDVINANPYNNFLVKTNSGYICSHNCFFDEISFIRNQDINRQKEIASNLLEVAIASMKTRFIHNGKNPTMLCLASSKRSDKSFLEEHMKKKLESEKENVYISDGSVWDVKPEGTYTQPHFKVALGHKFLQSKVIPDDELEEDFIKQGYQILDVPGEFKADFIDDIDKALCDYAGISSSSITKYINGEAVKDTITNRIKNPFVKEILEIGDAPDDDVQYYNFFDITKIDPQLRSKPLFIHMDMSISGDMTGIAGVFIRGKKMATDNLDQSKDLFYSLAFSVNIKAPKGRRISFQKNRNFIYWLKNQGFNIKGISTDSFQAYDTGEALRSRGYPYIMLSVDKVGTDKICVPYQYFRNTINEKRIELYNDKILIMEITDLERNMDTGKVDHPRDGCFTADTKVRLVDGRSLNFLDLINEYKSGKTNYVYSMNLNTKKIEPKRILKAWKTAENQSLVRLTFDNGESVECTPKHKFMLRNGEYIEAKDMIPGDSLMPLYRKYPSKGGLKEYPLYYEPFEDEWHFEHRRFATEVLDKKYLVHHKDCNPSNNSPDNLVWCSRSKHMQIHEKMQTGANSIQSRKKKSESVKKWHEENKGTEKYENRSKKTRESVLKHNFDKLGYNTCKMVEEHQREIERTFGVVYDELTYSQKNSYGGKLAQLKDPTINQRISRSLSKRHSEGKFENAYESMQKINTLNKQLKILYPTIDKDKFIELFGFDFDSLSKYQKGPWTNRYRQKLHEVLNHKLVSIEFLDKTEDVYDIEVEDNHNFALDCGVFVHNCKDVADALCGAVFNASTHAEEFAYDYGESSEELLRLNSDNYLSDKSIYDIEMEKELMKIGKRGLPERPSDIDPGRTDYNLYTDVIIM